jgi:hypothetical protein
VACHAGFLSGRLISSNEGTCVLFHHDSSAAPQTVQTASPVCGAKNLVQYVCTRRRNCIGQLSPLSEYAPGTARFPRPFPLVRRFVLRLYFLMLDG